MHLGIEECPVPFFVTVTLTSDLISRICIESGAYHPYTVKYESQIWCMDASYDGYMSCTILGQCDLDRLPSF